MPTGVEEVVGLAIGAISLLAAFKGAVDGYLLIESFFDKDNGLRDLALDYRIECQKLEVWGDRFKVKADREEDCLLYKESEAVKKLMAEIFGRIQHLNTQAKSFVEFHEATDYALDFTTLGTIAPAFNKQLQLGGAQVKAMSDAQMAKQQKKRVKWAIKNKDKFQEIVEKLRKANTDLDALLPPGRKQGLASVLPRAHLQSRLPSTSPANRDHTTRPTPPTSTTKTPANNTKWRFNRYHNRLRRPPASTHNPNHSQLSPNLHLQQRDPLLDRMAGHRAHAHARRRSPHPPTHQNPQRHARAHSHIIPRRAVHRARRRPFARIPDRTRVPAAQPVGTYVAAQHDRAVQSAQGAAARRQVQVGACVGHDVDAAACLGLAAQGDPGGQCAVFRSGYCAAVFGWV
jgi:hypothetical protein